MTKKALGYITMDAGQGVPGSILKWALLTYAPMFDYTVVVDGNITESSLKFYKTIPNLRLINSPWKGSHLPQYWARNSAVDEGDWLLALDDDEFPSSKLVTVAAYLANNDNPLNIFYTPSLTYLGVDSTDNFWRIQDYPTKEDAGRRSKRILYKKSVATNYFISSPCGMHVTPTHVSNGALAELSAIDNEAYFYHMKTIESFILNECIYNVSNPRHESGPSARQMSEREEIQFESLVYKYNLKDVKHFIQITKDHQWPDEFRDFVYKFKDLHGLAMCKFYYLYEYVSNRNFTDTKLLMDCISKGFYPVYEKTLESKEEPFTIPKTPTIWQ